MNFKKTVLTAGLAMFSMFFGSGNLVFPLVIGTQTLDQAPFAMMGLILTGIIVPFLGLIGVILFSGNRNEYFACIGKIPALLLIFFMLALLGPLGVIPRSITVMYGCMTLLFPNLPLPLFSFLFLLGILLIVWNHKRVIPIIGRVLTPLLLLGIGIISIAGLFFSDSIPQSNEISRFQAFWVGFVEGYQTMDLLAGFFFSATIVAYIKAQLKGDNSPKQLLKLSLTASLIGASLIAIIYISFVVLGKEHVSLLRSVNPEQMLVSLAGHSLGSVAIPIATITIILACVTTVTILGMFFANFVDEDILQGRLGQQKAIILTLAISYIVSLIGFDSIRVWLGIALSITYPAIIVLAIANIIYKLRGGYNWGKSAFWITTVLSALWNIT